MLYHEIFDNLSLRDRANIELVSLTPATKLEKHLASITGPKTQQKQFTSHKEDGENESIDEDERVDEENVLLETNVLAPTPILSSPPPPSQYNALSQTPAKHVRLLPNGKTDVPFILRDSDSDEPVHIFLFSPPHHFSPGK